MDSKKTDANSEAKRKFEDFDDIFKDFENHSLVAVYAGPPHDTNSEAKRKFEGFDDISKEPKAPSLKIYAAPPRDTDTKKPNILRKPTSL